MRTFTLIVLIAVFFSAVFAKNDINVNVGAKTKIQTPDSTVKLVTVQNGPGSKTRTRSSPDATATHNLNVKVYP